MKQIFLALFAVLLLLCTSALGWEGSLELGAEVRNDRVVLEPGIRAFGSLSLSHDWMGLVHSFDIRNFSIGEVQPVFNIWKKYLDLYYTPGEGYFWIDTPDFDAKIGMQLFHEGPANRYPLFLAPNGPPVPSVSWSWQPFDLFRLKTNWIFYRNAISNFATGEERQCAKTLYYRSWDWFPFPDLSLGFVEAILFLERSLDFPYMLSPFPYQMMQEYRSFSAPWSEPNNDNGLLGFWVEYSPSSWRLFGEVLVDDFYVNIFTQDLSKHPQKIAWNMGAEYSWDRHCVQLEFAGATKYTFQRTSMNIPPYQYVFFEEDPDLPLEYNMIGFLYGENSGVTSFTYSQQATPVHWSVTGEFVAFGHRDPFTPWHGEPMPEGKGFIWLDDEVLSFQQSFLGEIHWDVTPELYLDFCLGICFLQNVALQKGENKVLPLFQFQVGSVFDLQTLLSKKEP
ncbi:MAG TPA: hypothetical protein PLF96_01605 [Thermotogota bacterium]|nr:hypothetical protein [Thermotogota bacterium]